MDKTVIHISRPGVGIQLQIREVHLGTEVSGEIFWVKGKLMSRGVSPTLSNRFEIQPWKGRAHVALRSMACIFVRPPKIHPALGRAKCVVELENIVIIIMLSIVFLC